MNSDEFGIIELSFIMHIYSFCRSPRSQILFTILMTWHVSWVCMTSSKWCQIIPTSVLTESWSKTFNLLQSCTPTTSVPQTSFIAIHFQSALIVLPLGPIIVGGCESWPLTPLVVTILNPSCGVVSPVTMGDAWLQWDIHGPVCIDLYIHTLLQWFTHGHHTSFAHTSLRRFLGLKVKPFFSDGRRSPFTMGVAWGFVRPKPSTKGNIKKCWMVYQIKLDCTSLKTLLLQDFQHLYLKICWFYSQFRKKYIIFPWIPLTFCTFSFTCHPRLQHHPSLAKMFEALHLVSQVLHPAGGVAWQSIRMSFNLYMYVLHL